MQDKKKDTVNNLPKGKIKEYYIGGVYDKAVLRNETFSVIYRAVADLAYADYKKIVFLQDIPEALKNYVRLHK